MPFYHIHFPFASVVTFSVKARMSQNKLTGGFYGYFEGKSVKSYCFPYKIFQIINISCRVKLILSKLTQQITNLGYCE